MEEALRISGFLVKPEGSKRWWANLRDERFQRHAVLQRHAGQRADAVHQAADGGAFLGHGDEQFAGLAVLEQADGEVAFVAGDVELVGDGGAGVGQAAAQRFAGFVAQAARPRLRVP